MIKREEKYLLSFILKGFYNATKDKDKWSTDKDFVYGILKPLMPDYSLEMDNTQRKRIFDGIRTISNGYHEIDDRIKEIGKSQLIIEYSEKLKNTNFKDNSCFDLKNTMKSIRKIIETNTSIDYQLREELLKSYRRNYKRNPYIFLAESIFYAIAIDLKNPSNYIELVRPFAKHSNYKNILTDSPALPVEKFIGREDDENYLREKIFYDGQNVILHGISGIGKTELMKDIWQMAKNEFAHIAWISYKNDLKTSLCNQLLHIGYEISEEERSRLVSSCINDLEDSLLIIIDNFSSFDKKDYFLQQLSGAKCSIVVTSKEPISYENFVTQKIDRLSEENCIRLYLNHRFSEKYTIENEIEKRILKSILSNIGWHSLTIELLAKTAKFENMDIYELSERLKSNGLDFSEIKVDSNHENLLKYSTINNHIKVLFSIAKNSFSKKEIHILKKLAIFGGLHFSCVQLKEILDIDICVELQNLINRGWVVKEKSETEIRDSEMYSVHEISAYAIQEQSDMDPLYPGLLNSMSIILDSESTETLTTMIPYLGKIIDCFPHMFCSSEDVALFTKIGTIVRDYGGDYAKSAQIFSKALNNLKINSGEMNIQKSEILYELALVYFQQGNYDEAERNIMKSLGCKELSSNDEATALNALACVYRSQDRLKDAKKLFKQILGQLDIDLSENRILAGSINNNLGLIHFKLGEFEESENKYLDSLRFVEENTIDIATTYDNLGTLYGEIDQSAKQERYIEKSLAIKKELLGDTHVDTLFTLRNSAFIDFENEKVFEAKEKLEFIQTELEFMPELKSDIYEVYVALATIHSKLNQFDESLELYKKALSSASVLFGEFHTETAYICNEIGRLYLDHNKNDLAQIKFDKSCSILKKLFMSNELEAAFVYRNLGLLYYRTNRENEAIEEINKAIKIFIEFFDKNHHETIETQKLLRLVSE